MGVVQIPWGKADGTMVETNLPKIGWGEHPKYKLKNCKCGASQSNKEVYTLYFGSGSHGAWYVRCKKCEAMVSNENEAVAVDIWNKGDDDDRIAKESE